MHAGALTQLCETGLTEFKIILFSDVLMYGNTAVTGKRAQPQTLINHAIELKKCYVVDSVNTISSNSSSSYSDKSFMIMSADKSFVVVAADAVQKSEWVQAIGGAILNLKPSDVPLLSLPSSPTNADTHSHAPNWNNIGASFKKAVGRKSPAPAKQHSEAGMSSIASSPHSVSNANNNSAHLELDIGDDSSSSCWVWSLDANGKIVQRGYYLPGTAPTDNDDEDDTADFQEVLDDAQQRAIFRKHLEASHCSENLVFWEMASEYKKRGYAGQPQAQIDAARAIVDRFVRIGAPDQVCVCDRYVYKCCDVCMAMLASMWYCVCAADHCWFATVTVAMRWCMCMHISVYLLLCAVVILCTSSYTCDYLADTHLCCCLYTLHALLLLHYYRSI
jgi:Regulator of G protein signaling domain